MVRISPKVGKQAEMLPPLPKGTGKARASTKRTEDRRELILRVASRLFAKQGFANTTIAQIVGELGVTNPYVYYYFRDKQEIFEAATWRPLIECFTSLDFPDDDQRPAVEKVMDGLSKLVRATLAHFPVSVLYYREPYVFRPEFMLEANRLAHHFYDKLCPLLDQARLDGDLEFDENTRITALAACSIPGFIYSWYRPEGHLSPDEVSDQLIRLSARTIGLRRVDQSRARASSRDAANESG